MKLRGRGFWSQLSPAGGTITRRRNSYVTPFRNGPSLVALGIGQTKEFKYLHARCLEWRFNKPLYLQRVFAMGLDRYAESLSYGKLPNYLGYRHNVAREDSRKIGTRIRVVHLLD